MQCGRVGGRHFFQSGALSSDDDERAPFLFLKKITPVLNDSGRESLCDNVVLSFGEDGLLSGFAVWGIDYAKQGKSLVSTRYSPICTALSAAPLRIWSPESQKVRPFSSDKSLRTRPT